MGGYVTFPGGMMACPAGRAGWWSTSRTPCAGLANQVLAGVADRVFTAFPDVLKKGRVAWATRCAPTSRARRHRPSASPAARARCRLLVVGGSLGAAALNEIVPQALALIPPDAAPAGDPPRRRASRSRRCARQLPGRRRAGRATALHRRHGQRLCPGRLVICRAGALTVTEIGRRGRRRHLRALPPRGGRPPDRQCPLPGRCRAAAGWCRRPT